MRFRTKTRIDLHCRLIRKPLKSMRSRAPRSSKASLLQSSSRQCRKSKVISLKEFSLKEGKFSEFIKFSESHKSLKHELGSIQRSCLSHMCLACAVVAPWSLTQGLAGSNPFYCNDNFLVIEFSEFKENI